MTTFPTVRFRKMKGKKAGWVAMIIINGKHVATVSDPDPDFTTKDSAMAAVRQWDRHHRKELGF